MGTLNHTLNFGTSYVRHPVNIIHTVVWWGDLRERDHLEDLGRDGRIILQCIIKK
jgi:hypothetical protein